MAAKAALDLNTERYGIFWENEGQPRWKCSKNVAWVSKWRVLIPSALINIFNRCYGFFKEKAGGLKLFAQKEMDCDLMLIFLFAIEKIIGDLVC